ncbi:MAG: prepilin-type N-terminal cleavage/methylation domain-containing protein [Candidatus Omnitrophota bacterium]|jgi:type II secretory pathway pseudopilin PulG
MKKKNFTLSEILIVVVIIGILATIGIPLYNNTIENAKTKTCEINLRTILGAVEAQTLEQNSFPASLSKISDKNFEIAWAKVLKEEGALKIKLVYFLANLDKNGLVYAAIASKGPWIHKFIGEASTLKCPAANEGISYGINASLAGKTYQQYVAESAETVIVGDCASNTFKNDGDLDARHKEYGLVKSDSYANGCTRNKQHKKVRRSTSASTMHGR